MKKRRQVSSSVSAISKQKKKLKKEHLQLISMTIPGMVLLLLFNYLPMFGVILSFKKFKYNLGVWKSPWCGFDNFEFFFKSGSLMRLLKNTVGMNLLFLLTGTLLNIVLALLLYEITNFKSIIDSCARQIYRLFGIWTDIDEDGYENNGYHDEKPSCARKHTECRAFIFGVCQG